MRMTSWTDVHCAAAGGVEQFKSMPHPRLRVLEAEAVTAMSAAVGGLDLALESLAYGDARWAPTADQLGITTPCAGDLQEQIVDALGSTPPLALRRLSALLAVVSSMERIAANCAAIADLVPDLIPTLSGDRVTRRAVELAGVDTRARLVHARDALQALSTSWDPATPAGAMASADARSSLAALAAVSARLPHGSPMAAALPSLVEHLGHIDDEADEIAELSWRSRSRWARSTASAELEVPLGIGSGAFTVTSAVL
jgi:hypothetical protein